MGGCLRLSVQIASILIEECGIDENGAFSIPFASRLNSAILELMLSAPKFDAASLKRLRLDSSDVQNLDALSPCTGLEWIDISSCESLTNVDGLTACAQLKTLLIAHLAIEDLTRFTAVFEQCTELSEVSVTGCYNLKDLTALRHCTNLRTLDIAQCSALKNLEVVETFWKLTAISIGEEDLEDLSIYTDIFDRCSQLRSISISDCYYLKNIDELVVCTLLEKLSLASCDVQNIDVLAYCDRLTELSLFECENLRNIDVLRQCPELATLNIECCGRLGFEGRFSTREEIIGILEQN